MSRKFWIIIISFWFACIIAGACTYFYNYYSQKQEREQFVSEFNYDKITEQQESGKTSPIVEYNAELFINEIQQVTEKMNQFETTISTMIHNNNNLNSNLDYLLKAYQQSKFTMAQFSNVEITNSSLLQQKQFEKIADAIYNYLHASSIYYIVFAKKLKNPTPFLDEQYKTAQDNLSTSKAQLIAIIELHSENK